mmetsp:Transcript_9841/g.12889  ORF Transcript_9841/g.12889 Transcript_9841/m.12889 type:complete len:84 (+) Transcript_9841:1438-1689(+)
MFKLSIFDLKTNSFTDSISDVRASLKTVTEKLQFYILLPETSAMTLSDTVFGLRMPDSFLLSGLHIEHGTVKADSVLFEALQG